MRSAAPGRLRVSAWISETGLISMIVPQHSPTDTEPNHAADYLGDEAVRLSSPSVAITVSPIVTGPSASCSRASVCTPSGAELKSTLIVAMSRNVLRIKLCALGECRLRPGPHRPGMCDREDLSEFHRVPEGTSASGMCVVCRYWYDLSDMIGDGRRFPRVCGWCLLRILPGDCS